MMLPNLTMTNSRDLPQDLPGRRAPPGPGAGAARAALTSPASATDVALPDWAILFGAVTMRLRLLAQAAVDGPITGSRVSALPSQVLDCVSALEQLAQTLVHEHERLRDVGIEQGLSTAECRRDQ